MRAIAVTVIGFLLSGAAVAADQPGKQKKQKNEKHAVVHQESRDSHVAVHVVWSTHDIDIVRRHYAPHYRNLPPGLQKKYARTGQLPPGWQKKMQPLPASLERDCAPLPSGYRRGVIDAHAVIYDTKGIIVDVAVLF